MSFRFHPFRPIVFVGLAFVLILILAGVSAAAELSYTVELSRGEVVVTTEMGLARVEVSAVGYTRLTEERMPELPYRVVSMLLPQGEMVESVRFLASEGVRVAEGIEIARSGAMLSEDGKAGQGVAMAGMVSASGLYPVELGRYLGTGYLHGRGIASFAVYPVRMEGTALVVTERVTVEVKTKVTTERPVVRERYREGSEEGLREVLREYVVNTEMEGNYRTGQVRVEKKRGGFQPTSYPSLEGSAVDYLIVTTDALASEYQRLADWKTAKGVPTVVRTVEWIEAHARNGVDLPETIRFFLRDAYAKWGITYVLLGGDTDILPPRYATSRYFEGLKNFPVDMYFACLDGSWNDNHDKYWGEGFIEVPYDNPDLYAEVYQGRIPASTVSQVALIIDKIIQYETPCDPNYMDKYMFFAEVLFPLTYPVDPITLNGADFAEVVYGASLLGKPLDVVKMYETPEYYTNAIPENKAAALDSLDAGFNHVNHIGHGFRFNMSVADASIQVADADALTNGCRLFNLYMLNCTAAAFDFYCLAEHYLANPNGGAVSVIGANNSAFPNASDNYMNEYYDLLFDRDVVHVGETFARSRLPRTPIASMGDNVDLWTHYIYTILADPEMPLFTGSVRTVNVAHVPSAGLGTTSILVNVTSGGAPVDSAVVCLTKDGDDYEYGATNALGNVTLPFTAETAGTIEVVVTGLNLARHESSITVNGASGAYVNFAGLTVDDDTNTGSFGNSNGTVDAGETTDLTLSLINTGGISTGDVSLVLRCANPAVMVLDSTAAVGTIGAGQTKAATDPVRVAFDKDIVDETAVEFQLVIREESVDTWKDKFRKEVHAPQLELTTLRIYDGSPLGNGNGVVEAGEQFRLYYRLKNYGTGTATGLTAELADLDNMFVFYDSTDTYSDMGSFVEAENVDGFHMKEVDVSAEHRLELSVTDLFTRVYRDTIELRAPLPPTGLAFDASLGPDRLEISWTHSTSADVVRYDVYHSLTSGGPYTQVSVDPIDHAVFLDTGLASSTIHYYVVTAIDRSGNESTPSAQGSASTNPPQMPGFPILMETQTTSSPAVGDIDGDGDLEIVVGNKWIYAWHHNGQELKDGDGDPQSWGVLTLAGDEFTAPVALARVDNQPGLDIIAADLHTKMVYCVDYKGDALPGWPQQAENDFRAAPSAGDLDGNGSYEVIAVDSKGIIYAWRADGTEWIDGDNNPATPGVFYRTTPAVTFHFQAPTICDLDDDGNDEIILGTASDSVWAFNGNRTRVPGFPIKLNNDLAGSICAGDVDGDGRFELLAQTKGLVGRAYLINHDGTIATGWPVNAKIDGIFFTPAPALADFNNDGKLECVVYTWVSGTAKINIFTYTGTNYPGWPKTIGTTYTDTSSLTVGDVNGDGSPDIVLGDESRYIYAWSITGSLIPGFPVQAEDAVRSTPFLTDVDLDGDIDMIVHSWDQNIYAFDLAGTYNRNLAPWPTAQANSHRNGRYGFVVATPPAAPTNFVALPGHNKVHLTWTNPTDPNFVGVKIRRVAWGDYADYATAEPLYPQAHNDGTPVTQTSAAAYDDEVNPRDIYYYAAFSYDYWGNYSSVTTTSQCRSTSYWLGDISPANGGDGYVNISDLALFSAVFGQVEGGPYWNEEVDFGRTDNYSRFGIPMPDDVVNFEDLMIFAMNYQKVSPSGTSGLPLIASSDKPLRDQVSFKLVPVSRDENRVTYAVVMENEAKVLKGFAITLSYGMANALLEVTPSATLTGKASEHFFGKIEREVGKVEICVAALGVDTPFEYTGEVARVLVLEEGPTGVTLDKVDLRDVNNAKDEVTRPGGDETPFVPAVSALMQNHPNPFNPTTTITYDVATAGPVRVDIYDVSGRLVRKLVNGPKDAGRYVAEWDGHDANGTQVTTGLYFYRMTAPGYVSPAKKMLLLK